MKRFINLPCILLSILTLKVLFTGTSIGDAIGLFALGSLSGFWFYLEENREEPINEQCKKDILTLAKEIDTVKAALNSVKLANNITTTFNRGR